MNILLIEDDANLCNSIQQQLTKENFHVEICNDGENGLFYALNENFNFDIVVVDRMLPIIDGLTIIKALRKKGIQTPIIIITGMSEIDNKIEGLDNGADDYLVKPFHIRELSARMRALIRRPAQMKDNKTLAYSDLHFIPVQHRLNCNDHSVILSKKESDLLELFLSNPQNSYSREQIIYKVWGNSAEIENGNVDNYIYFLRKHLKTLNSQVCIHSIYGNGYILEEQNAK